MYSLVVYVLLIYVAASFPLAYFGKIAFTPISLLYSLIILFSICLGLNFICSKILKLTYGTSVPLPFQYESSIITAITLYLILVPAEDTNTIISLCVAAVVATLSKYILVCRNTHIFNPAALGIFVSSSLFGLGTAFWWVGNIYFFPLVLLGGLIILQKTRRYALVISALIATLLGAFLTSYYNDFNFVYVIYSVFVAGPAIYFLSPMLQEPHTITKNKFQQILYGFLIVILPTVFAIMSWKIGWISMDFTLALLIGNLFSFIISHRMRLVLKLKEIKKLNDVVSEFVFVPLSEGEGLGVRPFKFKAGEYMEWALPHVNADSRSIRRYFTISSCPSDIKNKGEIAFTTKFPVEDKKNKMSSFKKALQNLKVGDKIYATQLGGDFLLPNNKSKNLCLIAGGIGVTPYISQIRSENDLQIEKPNAKSVRNVTLFYSARSMNEVAYLDLFKEVISKNTINLRVILVIGDGVVGLSGQESKNIFIESGHLNDVILNKYLQDFKNTEFYLSGPNIMVDKLCTTLGECKIHNSKIHTDYFPGF